MTSVADEARVWVGNLQPGDDVHELYAVRSKELRQRRGGGSFLTMVLADRSGEIAALAWDHASRLDRAFQVGDVVEVHGQVQRYNQRLQLIVRQAERVPSDTVDLTTFVRASRIDRDLLWQRLMAIIEDVDNPHLSQLLFRVFADPKVAERFREAPAARTMHHAFAGGLLEHTVSMAVVAKTLSEHYELDRDLVVAGTLLHDLGKIWELESTATISYTDDGRLLGHLPMVVLYIEGRIGELATFPSELRRQLLHLVLAHHGEHAYGSPVRPKTPEAYLVHMVDNLDAKLAAIIEAIDEEPDAEAAWTGHVPIMSYPVYRRRPSADSKTGKG